MNNDIKASVIQCGILSESFPILRGARQGDPIAAYVFIMCAEILSLMTKNNKKIKGITIDDKEYKLTQFADDTTLLLDGSKTSLQGSLNVLEIFGNISGLRMNTDKTKIIWIGRKKFSKDKISTKYQLEWGTTKFKLLGIDFSVELKDMTDMNFTQAINKIEKIIAPWKKRMLTPIGKITVIKTFLLTKLNHLFTSLRIPP